MKMEYWCCCHSGYTNLNKNGGCEFCGSQAVVYRPVDVEPVYIPEKDGPFFSGREALAFVGAIFVGAFLIFAYVWVASAFSRGGM